MAAELIVYWALWWGFARGLRRVDWFSKTQVHVFSPGVETRRLPPKERIAALFGMAEAKP